MHLLKKVHRMTTNISQSFDALPDTGYLRQAQFIPHVVPFSSSTLWRKVGAGTFPKPTKLSERVTCWKVGDIRQWMKAQVQAQADR